MSEAERDPYETIFECLKHTLRRKLLRLLGEGPKGFSELQRALGVDSSHLSYHLGRMSGLVSKEGEGYRLTGLGKKALRLVEGVEGASSIPARVLKLQRRVLIVAMVLMILSFAISLTPVAIPRELEPELQLSVSPVLIYLGEGYYCEGPDLLMEDSLREWRSPPCPGIHVEQRDGIVYAEAELEERPDDLMLMISWLTTPELPAYSASPVCRLNAVYRIWAGEDHVFHAESILLRGSSQDFLDLGPEDFGVSAKFFSDIAPPSYLFARNLTLEIHIGVECWTQADSEVKSVSSGPQRALELRIEGKKLSVRVRRLELSLGEVRYYRRLADVVGPLPYVLVFCGISMLFLVLGVQIGATAAIRAH
ncbi:MAG TPA: ArsR family transcriptional regulator [Candidatus Korarchaeota archaeon]|nr:ArsR family transcriptional regulator [Candidatus Korarchaeota archaeon]